MKRVNIRAPVQARVAFIGPVENDLRSAEPVFITVVNLVESLRVSNKRAVSKLVEQLAGLDVVKPVIRVLNSLS
jgi:hypothetical protein